MFSNWGWKTDDYNGQRSKLKVIHAESYGVYNFGRREGEIVECLLDYLNINSICLSDCVCVCVWQSLEVIEPIQNKQW